MSDDEYEHEFARWRDLLALDRRSAVIEACRGSGNPALLAWLAEALEIDHTSTVIDVGCGLGGPCAWLVDRYRCRVLGAEPVTDGARACASLFGVPAVAATGDAIPFRTGVADSALLLGVVSAVADPAGLLAEVGRVARTVGILAYVATGDAELRCGGSHFRPATGLTTLLERAGWRITAGPQAVDLPPPPSWDEPQATAHSRSGHGAGSRDEPEAGDEPGDEADDEQVEDERDVARALAAGRIGVCLLIARWAGPGSEGRAGRA